ncbi:MAG: ABC transporter ATP-binding protein [Thermoplasmata archaeon]
MVITLIEVRAVEYSINRFHLGPVSLSVKEGKILGIGGPNGSGKSTLLRVMLRLLRPTGGRITVDGEDIEKMTQRDLSRRLAYLPQNLFSPLNLSVQDVLLASQYSLEKKSSKLDAIINRYGIENLKHRDFNSLSGGEKRLVMLIGAITQDSDAILMDEPDTFLDVDKEIQVMEEIMNLRESGRSVIVILHDLNKLAKICDNILMLKSGKVIAYGPTGEVLVPEVLEKMYSASFRIEQGTGSMRIDAFPKGRS